VYRAFRLGGADRVAGRIRTRAEVLAEVARLGGETTPPVGSPEHPGSPPLHDDANPHARHALCELLDRLGADGVTAWLNSEGVKALQDEAYAFVMWLEQHARVGGRQKVLDALEEQYPGLDGWLTDFVARETPVAEMEQPGGPRYYIRDTRSVVGNCALWWRPDGAGYTTQLEEAGTWGEAEARRMELARETDRAVPVEVARAASVTHVRVERLGREMDRATKGGRS
jgi:hypothetical protein